MKRAAALRIATDEDAPSEKSVVEARLRTHIEQHDATARELAQLKALIADESRRYATLDGITVRPTIDMLRHQLRIGQ